MNSINTILHSEKFQRESPERLSRLIRRHQRETFKPEASAFSPMSPTDRAGRGNYELNQRNEEAEKKNAA